MTHEDTTKEDQDNKTNQAIFQYRYKRKTEFSFTFIPKLRTTRGEPQDGECCSLGAVGPARGERRDNGGEVRPRNVALILYYRFYENRIE